MTIAIMLTVTLITVLLICALRPLAEAVRLVDRPGGRKRHVGEVPIVGGIAMFLSVSLGVALMPGQAGDLIFFLAAGGLLVLIGLIDDRFGLAASVRLVAQLSSVLVMAFGAGIMMTDIGNPLWIGVIGLGPMALVITVLIFIAVINAYNTIDGLDGLAGSMALIALLASAIVAETGSNTQTMSLIVAAAIGGYLVFNLPVESIRPFRAFMGDAGSTFLGVAVVWLTVSVCQGEDRVISPVHGLWFAALPLFDLFTCFARRTRARRSPFSPGRDHFHHILLESGMRVREVTATLAGLQTAYAAFGIFCHHVGLAEPLVFAFWAVLGVSQLSMIRAIARLIIRLRRREQAA